MYLIHIKKKTKGKSRCNPKAGATAINSPPPAKATLTTAKGAVAKGGNRPAMDATIDERGRVYAPRELVQIAPEHQALAKCK